MPINENEIQAQIMALRGQLPQWNADASWAYDTSKVFGGPKSYSYQSDDGDRWNSMQHGLNLKEQEAERLEEIARQARASRGRY